VRERWFGATGLKVPEIAVEGQDLEVVDPAHVRLGEETFHVLLAQSPSDEQLGQAHAEGIPVLVRAKTAEEVKAALARPEVACVLIPPAAGALRELDLTELTYG
jgi:hypothetical protein